MRGKISPAEVDSIPHATGPALNSPEGSLEVTGLGLIACLVIAFFTFVRDGSLPLSSYLWFISFLLAIALALVVRIVKRAHSSNAESAEPK